MNAVERLWRALRTRDWQSAVAQLHPGAVVVWPHTHERFASREEYVTRWRTMHGRRSIAVHEVVAEGKLVAVRATVSDDEGRWQCGAFYELREGRVAQGTELWVPDRS